MAVAALLLTALPTAMRPCRPFPATAFRAESCRSFRLRLESALGRKRTLGLHC
jgi:hypothetical protein